VDPIPGLMPMGPGENTDCACPRESPQHNFLLQHHVVLPDDITRGFAPQQPAGATGPGEFSRLLLMSRDGRSVPFAIVGFAAS